MTFIDVVLVSMARDGQLPEKVCKLVINRLYILQSIIQHYTLQLHPGIDLLKFP